MAPSVIWRVWRCGADWTTSRKRIRDAATKSLTWPVAWRRKNTRRSSWPNTWHASRASWHSYCPSWRNTNARRKSTHSSKLIHLCTTLSSGHVKQGGGLIWRSQVGAKPLPIPQSTNLALFGHKITLYRFNQGEAHTIAGGSNRSRGGMSPRPPSL